uniref:I-set domain-containing protein n=1 Tax=Rhodnius prolixus TaxID=13249 RepID=T1HAV8_RHOPR
MFTYTNDERFQVLHTEGSDDWTLQIKYVQKRDNGAYECQVATGRGTLSHYFNLIVVVPTAYILGTGEYHIGQGSTINLVCIIENLKLALVPSLEAIVKITCVNRLLESKVISLGLSSNVSFIVHPKIVDPNSMYRLNNTVVAKVISTAADIHYANLVMA